MTITREDLDTGRVDLSDLGPLEATLPPLHPGELLREEFLPQFGLSAYRLAKDIGVPVNAVTAILAEKRAISPLMALRLARRFGTSAELWLNLQVDHDLAVARAAVGDELDKITPAAGG